MGTPKKVNYKDRLDRVFSEYIRRRDADENGYIKCISCGKRVHWKEADAGHYVNRKHMNLRWDEKNVNAQCRSCNRFDEGNMIGYTQGLVEKYGESILEKLRISRMRIFHIHDSFLKLMIEDYKKKIKELGQ